MTNATLRGKPDAGNPHVRFDEGEVAPAKPGRGSLLYKGAFALSLAVLWAAVAQAFVYSARSYVQNGLVGHFDGKENAGYGQHDGAAATWKNLMGTDFMGDFPLDVIPLRIWGDAYLQATTGDAYSANRLITPAAVNLTTFTIENVVRTGSDGLVRRWEVHPWANTFEAWSTSTEGYLERVQSTRIAAVSTLSANADLQFASTYDAATHTAYLRKNGVLASKTAAYAGFSLSGCVGFCGTLANGRIYGLRVYTRALTIDELNQNNVLDQLRLLGKTAETVTLPTGWTMDADGTVRNAAGTALFAPDSEAVEPVSTSLALNEAAGGTFTAPADAVYTGITFGSDAGAYTVAGTGITLNGLLANESAAAQTITAPLAVPGGALMPAVGGGLTLANVTAAGAFAPQGTGGAVTLTGSNSFAGPLILKGNPLVVSPRVYTTSGWSKDLAGTTDQGVQVTYWLRGDGVNSFTSLEDLTAGQRGDVIILEGSNSFSGNLQPNGNDGYLVLRGRVSAGNMNWDSNRGHNSRLYVESGAEVTVAGTFTQTGGKPAHAYVDGTFTVGTINLASGTSSLTSPGKQGVVNAGAVRVNALSSISMKDFTLNLGAGGLNGAGTAVGNVVLGPQETTGTKCDATPTFAGTTFRAATPAGVAAKIRLLGTPTIAETVTKTGAGDLVFAPSSYDKLTGTVDVQAGRVLCGANGTLALTLNLAEGTALGAEAGVSAEVTHAVFAGATAMLVFGADANGVGSLTLPTETLASASAVTVVLDGAPVAGTTATLISGAQLADAAKFTLAAPEGVVGTLAVQDGNLVLTVTASTTQAVKDYVWTGAASTLWDLTTANWLDGAAAAPFSTAENAFFNGTDAGDGAVEVDANGVRPNNVTFDAEKTYKLTGGQISGSGKVTVKGGATVEMAGATLDQQEVVVESGILKAGAEKPELFGDSTKEIVIKEGGSFDINATSKTTESQLTTHQKRYRIAGAGPDGRGAIRNEGLNNDAVARLHTIYLDGDATVSSGSRRIDMRSLGSSALAGRPQVYGPTNTLTVKGAGSSFCFIDADLNLGKLRLVDDAIASLESGAKENLADGVEIATGGYMQFWNHSAAFASPVKVTEGVGRIGNGWGTVTVSGPITVADGATLTLRGNNRATARYTGGFFGPGAVQVGGDLQNLVSDFEQTSLTVTNGFAIYGNNAADGDGKKWPKNVTIQPGFGYLAFAPSTNKVYSGYAITGTGGYFCPSWQGSNKTDAVSGMKLVKDWSKIPVSTVEDTTVSGVSLGLGIGHTGLLICQAGAAVFGNGFVGNFNNIHLGAYNTQPDSAMLTLAGGSSVSVKKDGEITLGQWSGATNNIHKLIVDGGTFDASAAKPPRVGYDGRAAEFLVKSGTVKLPGVALRSKIENNMTADAAGIGYEVFSMAGGTVELAGNITTERFYPWTPQIWFGGGTLTSLADWSTDFYQVSTFEPWGDASGTKTFTLDTNGKKVTYRSALQGNSSVRIVGAGDFVADDGVQGGVTGHWTVENTGAANLKNAAAFAKGLTLAEGTAATIDIGARTNYVSLAVGCEASTTIGANQFTYDNFYNRESIFSSLVTKKTQALITKTSTPTYTAYRQDAEFYVDEADTYTFGVSYDDRGDVMVDGTRVAYNSAWNNVGTGQVALQPGWHKIALTCKDNAGGAGPTSNTSASQEPNKWRQKGMAAGFHKGATTSTAAADFSPIDSTALKMRPVNTVRWTFRYIGTKMPTDWRTGPYDFSMFTNSMQKIHDTGWAPGKLGVNTFSGWTYVEPEDAGEWSFDGVYDDSIYVDFDGQKVFENGTRNAAKSSKAQVNAGWHSFRVVVGDYGGGISWSGVSGYGAALYVKRPKDAAKVPFDERNLRMSADPYGFIGGELNVGEGATLTNTSDTPCELTGTVVGTGTLKGPYALTGAWNIAMDDGRTLKAVTFEDGVDLRNGQLNIALAKRPVSAKYVLGPATGLDDLTQEERDAKLNVTLNGEAYERSFGLVMEDGKAVLKNLKPTGTVFYMR